MTPMGAADHGCATGHRGALRARGGYLDRLATAIAASRGAGIAVTYVTVAFRPGYPEVSARNKSFSAIAGTGRFTGGDPKRTDPGRHRSGTR